MPLDAVAVRLRAAHSRAADAAVEAGIDAEWDAKLQAHPRMFNGKKFRYAGAQPVGKISNPRIGSNSASLRIFACGSSTTNFGIVPSDSEASMVICGCGESGVRPDGVQEEEAS